MMAGARSWLGRRSKYEKLALIVVALSVLVWLLWRVSKASEAKTKAVIACDHALMRSYRVAEELALEASHIDRRYDDFVGVIRGYIYFPTEQGARDRVVSVCARLEDSNALFPSLPRIGE